MECSFETQTTHAETYAFDAMGNRLSKQDSAPGATNYTYNAANMLLTNVGSGGNYGIAHDADGNSNGNGGLTNYTWDGQNRLASTINTDTLIGTSHTYGADGLRRSQTVQQYPSGTPTTTYYVYDGQTLVREMQKNQQGVLVPSATYLYGPRDPSTAGTTARSAPLCGGTSTTVLAAWWARWTRRGT